MIEIREARPEDEGGLRVLEDQLTRVLRRTYRPTPEGLANRSRLSSDFTRLVALRDGEVVAGARYYLEEGIMRVVGMVVREDSRQGGISRLLLDRMVEMAREWRCSAVRLFTLRETGNVPIFLKLGFHVLEARPAILYEGPDGGEVWEVEMELEP